MLENTLGELIAEECSKFSVNELAGLIGVSPEELADLGKESMPILPITALAPESRPSCFAHPLAYDAASTKCHGCAVRTECSLLFKTGVWPEELPAAPVDFQSGRLVTEPEPPSVAPPELPTAKTRSEKRAKALVKERAYREKKAAAGMKRTRIFASEDLRKSLKELSAARSMTLSEVVEDVFKAHAESTKKIQELTEKNQTLAEQCQTLEQQHQERQKTVLEVWRKTLGRLKEVEAENDRLLAVLKAIRTQLDRLAPKPSTDSPTAIETPAPKEAKPTPAAAPPVVTPARTKTSPMYSCSDIARFIGYRPQAFILRLIADGWVKRAATRYRATGKGVEDGYVKNVDFLVGGIKRRQVKVTPLGLEKFTEMYQGHTQLKIMP